MDLLLAIRTIHGLTTQSQINENKLLFIKSSMSGNNQIWHILNSLKDDQLVRSSSQRKYF